MLTYETLYDFLGSEEVEMDNPITVIDGYDWGFKEHVRLSTLYKNGQFSDKNDQRDFRPFKNIVRPIVTLQYFASGFDVKDIEIFVNDKKNYYKSFLVKKFHDKWARENGLDTFIDQMVESYVDYGGALVKKTKNAIPEVVPLQSVAVCDQTDILSGPIAIKHYLAPDQLKEKESLGWGSEANGATSTIDEVIQKSSKKKSQDKDTTESRTPGRYVEVYEVHGVFPSHWLEGEEKEEVSYTRQLHIVCFYKDENDTEQWVTLFKGKEAESPFKLIKRDPVFGRGLGFGGIEELFEPQVWVNFDMIAKTKMLESAAITILKTTDPTLAAKHPTGLKNLKNLSILDIQEGRDISPVDTFPRNMALFDRSVNEWEAHAQQIGGASDALLGIPPKSQTPFALQELVVQTGKGPHEYRKSKLAFFLEEIYQDWILPYLSTEVSNEQEFIAELDLDEMKYVVQSVMNAKADEWAVEKTLNGDTFTEEEIMAVKEEARVKFMESGFEPNKKFIEILKGEMKKAPLSLRINIAAKQYDLVTRVGKLSNIIRQIIAAPQVLQIPGMADIFNQIIEASGLSPVDFSNIKLPEPAEEPTPVQPTAPALA